MIASAPLSYDPDGHIMGALCICGSELRAHRTTSMQCPNDWPRTFRPASNKDYGGDLFGTCEEGQHAWRPSYTASGYPCGPATCKWCGTERPIREEANA